MFDTGIRSVFKAAGPSACRLHVGTPASSLSSVLCRKRVLSRGTMESRVGQLLNESSRPNTQHTPTLKTRLCSVANVRRQEGGFAAAVFAKRFLASFGGASSHFRAMGASSSVSFSQLQLISCFSLSWQRCVVVFFFFALPQGCETARVPRQKKRKVFGRKELWMFFVCLYTKLHFVLPMNGRMSAPVFSQDTSGFLASIWTCFALAFILL